MAIQDNGKIVVVGETADTNSTFSDIAVVRYNLDGSLDTSFGTGGIVTTDMASSLDRGFDVAIQSDGKIVAVGERYYLGNPDNAFALVRYNADGSLDTSFGSGGKVISDLGIIDRARGVALQSDGKIVAAGEWSNASFHSDMIVARYNSNGSLDTSFDTDGLVLTDFWYQCRLRARRRNPRRRWRPCRARSILERASRGGPNDTPEFSVHPGWLGRWFGRGFLAAEAR